MNFVSKLAIGLAIANLGAVGAAGYCSDNASLVCDYCAEGYNYIDDCYWCESDTWVGPDTEVWCQQPQCDTNNSSSTEIHPSMGCI
jgi:hypothetical protein